MLSLETELKNRIYRKQVLELNPSFALPVCDPQAGAGADGPPAAAPVPAGAGGPGGWHQPPEPAWAANPARGQERAGEEWSALPAIRVTSFSPEAFKSPLDFFHD